MIKTSSEHPAINKMFWPCSHEQNMLRLSICWGPHRSLKQQGGGYNMAWIVDFWYETKNFFSQNYGKNPVWNWPKIISYFFQNSNIVIFDTKFIFLKRCVEPRNSENRKYLITIFQEMLNSVIFLHINKLNFPIDFFCISGRSFLRKFTELFTI